MRSSLRPAFRPIRPFATVVATAALLLAGGCGSHAGSGAFLGAGLGALSGQAIGGDTEATLIGTAIAAGVGYAIGNEIDKAEQGSPRHRGHHDPHGRRYRDHCGY